MPFTLGGDGNILPPRKNQNNGLGAPMAPSAPLAQTSQPAFIEPDLKVRAADQATKLPAGTPSNVFAIARRKAKTLPQAVQSAIAQSGGAVIPLANVRVGQPVRPAVTQTQQPAADAGYRGPSLMAPQSGTVDRARLCAMVFVLEAAKRSRGLEINGNSLTPEQVAAVAVKLLSPLKALLDSGKIPAEDYAACVAAYCKRFGCEEVTVPPPASFTPPTEPQPAPPPAREPPPAQPPANASIPPASDMVSMPPPPPPPQSPPPANGSGITPFVPSTPPPEPPQPPMILPIIKPAEKKSSSSLWWLVALIGGGLLIKKLSAVKVVGAAMAGAPLIAELESDEPESEENEPEEAHENEE